MAFSSRNVLPGKISSLLIALGIAAGVLHDAAFAADTRAADMADETAGATCTKEPTRACVMELARRQALSISSKQRRARELAWIARKQAEAGLVNDARATANLALREAEKPNAGSAKELMPAAMARDEVFVAVAKLKAKLGNFDEAKQLANTLDNKYLRPDVLAAVAVSLGRSGMTAKGLQLVQAIPDKRLRDLAVRRVVWDLRYFAIERGEEAMLIDAMRVVEAEEERPGFYSYRLLLIDSCGRGIPLGNRSGYMEGS